MGLSKRNRARTSRSQIGPNQLNLPYTREIAPGISQAIRTRVWLAGMQKHLEKTAAALKDRPAEALAPFQKMLGRTSYFSTSAHAGQWVVMFGPKPGSTTAVASLPKQPAVLQPVLAPDFPAFSRRVTVFGAACLHFVVDSARSLYQWLMHPVVDTREPS